jgi:hypothetical protein
MCSFGLNHYGTAWATGSKIVDDKPGALTFGSYERVYEKDGQVIGNRGENGHPYDGTCQQSHYGSSFAAYNQCLGASVNYFDTAMNDTS